MRHLVRLAAFSLLTVACAPACASGLDGKTPDQQSIDALEARAQQAPPREQCFSVRQYAAGDVEKSASLLRHIQQLAHNMHLSMADDNKRLKNAEILLRHTAFRLTEMLHASSLEDRPLVEETLVQVNQAQTDAMMQVFRK
jgi:methylphosphotriester-DNA--protein-cysteine methyltransferase